MKTKILSLVVLSILLASCQKFVDIKKSSTQSFLETANDCQLLFDNYEVFNTNDPYDGEISTADYELDANSYNSDAISIEDRNMYTWSTTSIRASSDQWVKSYHKIYQANLVMAALDDLSGKEQPAVLNNLRGTALFFRAYALWNVAQLYAKPYGTSSAQDPGVPVHLIADINDITGRGTVKETYDRILQDLTEAATLINSTSNLASRPNKAAVFAMLARTYLSMEDYPNALTAATNALAIQNTLIDYNTLNAEGSGALFSARYNKEVIFQSVMTKSVVLNPGSMFFDQFAKIPSAFISTYADNDLRKALFFKENFDIDTESPAGTYRFAGNYEPTTSSILFTGLAVDELYLIRAECYARATQTASAMADLNTLLRSRWLTGIYVDMTASTPDEALTKILAERRKELIMRGQRWTDLRRLNKDSRFAVTLSRTVNGMTYTLPPNDGRYTLLIPQEVIVNSALPQNQR